MNVREALSEFIIDQRVRGNSSKTIDYYKVVISIFADYYGWGFPVKDITLSVCKEYYLHLAAEKSVNSVSVQSYVRGLRSFLRWLYESGYIEDNICQRFKLPKATRKVIDVLSDEEIERLLSALSGSDWLTVRNRLIVALMLDSGLRLNEVITLKASSVHLKDRYMIVTGKGDKQRTVPFGEFTAQTLDEYFNVTKRAGISSNLIIKVSQTLCGFEPVTEATIKNMFRKLKIRADFPRFSPLDNIKKDPLL